jgi:hypothetical protein
MIKIPEKIKEELLARAEREQALRSEWDDKDSEELRLKVLAEDENNTSYLKQVVKEYGWPKISDVGEKVAMAAWLIAQHSPDLGFMKKCLKLMEAEPDEVDPKNLVRTIDRARILTGKRQYYGTHFTKDKSGKWVPQPIEDVAHVDERRAKIGLPSLEQKSAEYNKNP